MISSTTIRAWSGKKTTGLLVGSSRASVRKTGQWRGGEEAVVAEAARIGDGKDVLWGSRGRQIRGAPVGLGEIEAMHESASRKRGPGALRDAEVNDSRARCSMEEGERVAAGK